MRPLFSFFMTMVVTLLLPTSGSVTAQVKESNRDRTTLRRLNVSFEFIEGESAVISLDLKGVAASTGSACTSGAWEASHVLLAMGIPATQSHSSLRFTMGKWTTEEEIDQVLEILPRVVSKLRSISPLFKGKA